MRRPAIYICMSLFLGFLWCGSAMSAITVTSSISRIPRGQPSIASLRYNFTNIASTSVSSPQGLFYVDTASGPINIGSANGPLSAVITIPPNFNSGSGTATESIEISVGLMEHVLERGTSRFYYQRTFTTAAGPGFGPVSFQSRIDFQIVLESTADLSIKYMNLYFENRRAEITVERRSRSLKAFAEIAFSGTGLLEGYWEVDGRILSRVVQQLSFGGTIILETPDIPELPTFDPGSHRVRFVITRPALRIPTPVIIYFVDLEELRPVLNSIAPFFPGDGAVLDYTAQKFEWQKTTGAAFFLVQFGDKVDAKAIHSAYTRDTFYVLPKVVLESRFRSGQRYYWKVTAFDSENGIAGVSPVLLFTLK